MGNHYYDDIEKLAEKIKPIERENDLPQSLQKVLKFKQEYFPEVENATK